MESRYDYLLKMGGPFRPGWPYAPGPPPDMETALAEVQDLFNVWRLRACWWMRSELKVTSPELAQVVLKAVRDRADKHTWIRCMELMKWLSPHIKETS